MNPFPRLGFVPSMRGMGASYCGRKGMPVKAVPNKYG